MDAVPLHCKEGLAHGNTKDQTMSGMGWNTHVCATYIATLTQIAHDAMGYQDLFG